jgi:hypothetical protein
MWNCLIILICLESNCAQFNVLSHLQLLVDDAHTIILFNKGGPTRVFLMISKNMLLSSAEIMNDCFLP